MRFRRSKPDTSSRQNQLKRSNHAQHLTGADTPTAPMNRDDALQPKAPSRRGGLTRGFSLKRSTEWSNRSDEEMFFGPYAHIRKTIDYTYHSNYVKTRQWLQDSIIEKLMGELVRTSACDEYDLKSSATPDILNNGSGIDIWAKPKEPWLVMVAGKKGTDTGMAIKSLLVNNRLPLMGFVLVDPQEIRMLLPEYAHLHQKNRELGIELTEKETGYIIEVLTLAALEAGTNVVVYGYFKEVTWYQQYCRKLQENFKQLKIGILHIMTDAEGEDGSSVAEDLVSHTDYYCCLKIFSEKDMEIMTDGVTWLSFGKSFEQRGAWGADETPQSKRLSMFRNAAKLVISKGPTFETIVNNVMVKSSRHHDGVCSIRSFNIEKSTEENHMSNDMYFYGPYAHIRKELDYSYHCNYRRERQLLQDAVISEYLVKATIKDKDGKYCSTPTEPFVVFTAGAMGAGKGHVINYMDTNGYFPLASFVLVDPDEIRSLFPEYELYKSENPFKAGEMTRKEAGYIVEILTLFAMQAGKNVLVDGSLRDWEWYGEYFDQLKGDYPAVKISILHIDAPRDVIIKRAEARGNITGRKIPIETLEMAIRQVPISVAKLKDQVDSYYKVNNAPSGVELMTENTTWSMFQDSWLQTCAWIPKAQSKKKF